MESSYHEKCVRCCICGEALGYTCYVKNSKLYCKLDYDRIYVKKCLGCSERISPEELIMRTSDYIFHLRCFICVVCGLRLQKGDLYVIKQGQLFCRIDYEKEVEMMQGFGHGEVLCDDFLPTSRQQDGRRGPKRPRTILTTQQRRAFKASFELSPKPCRKVRETLAKDTGLSVRIVQVWFQNQRAKMKKMEKKAHQENKGPRDAESDEKKLVVKEEEHSPRSGYLNDSCSDTENNCETDQSLQQMTAESKPFVDIKHELEVENIYHKHDLRMSFYSGLSAAHEMRSKSGNPDEFMGIFESHRRDSLPSQPVSANPIDKLYSMQSSYFCTYQDQQLEQ